MDYVKIGRIVNTHGVKGELKIFPLTNDINRFDDLITVYLGDNKINVEIEGARHHKGMVIIKLKEFNNINEVLKFKEDYIYVDEDDKVTLPEDDYFIFDIIDCDVFDKQKHKIGVVTDVIQSTGNDVYVIKDEKKGKEYLIPSVKKFVTHIDIENKKIIIDPIEGMIE